MNLNFSKLSNTSLIELHAVFLDAFSIYEIPLGFTLVQFTYLLERRGYDLDSSYGAFHEGKLIGYIINSIGMRDKQLSAYDISTGLLREYHKKGIAQQLMTYTIAGLKEKGIQQYFLEVIRTNPTAFALYKRSGFVIHRDLNFYVFSKEAVSEKLNNKSTTVTFKEIKTPDWEMLSSFWDFEPTWQNSLDSVKGKAAKFKIIGAFKGEDCIGYGIMERHTGDIPQLAVHKDHRREGIGTVLLGELFACTGEDRVRLINVESGCEAFMGFVDFLGLTDEKGQYEMRCGVDG